MIILFNFNFIIMKKFFIALLGLCGIYFCLLVANNSYGITPPGEGGVIVTLGSVSSETNHGFTLKWPVISKLVNYNLRQQNKDYANLGLKTRDLQNVYLSFSVIYQINGEKLPLMVQEYGMNNYVHDILSPKIEAAIQEVVGKNDVWLLVTDKAMITEALEYILSDKLSEDNYLLLKDVLLKTPKFDKLFEDEILAKLTDEVKLEKAKIQTQIVQEEAKQMFAKASVDPQVMEMMSEAITNPLIIKYEAMKALNKWNGEVPSTVISGTDNALPIIGIKK